MNPYFALSAIFLLGLRGIEKKLELPGPPISHFTPEDRMAGKVCFAWKRLMCMAADGRSPDQDVTNIPRVGDCKNDEAGQYSA